LNPKCCLGDVTGAASAGWAPNIARGTSSQSQDHFMGELRWKKKGWKRGREAHCWPHRFPVFVLRRRHKDFKPVNRVMQVQPSFPESGFILPCQSILPRISIFLLDNPLRWCNLIINLAFSHCWGGSASVPQVPRFTKVGLSRAANFSGRRESQRRS
jgi:hypothetical protein